MDCTYRSICPSEFVQRRKVEWEDGSTGDILVLVTVLIVTLKRRDLCLCVCEIIHAFGCCGVWCDWFRQYLLKCLKVVPSRIHLVFYMYR
jgi:hypothetical protein